MASKTVVYAERAGGRGRHWGRPVWEDGADEAREDLLPRALVHRGTGRGAEQALLAPLTTAVEAGARRDARAGCASDRVAEGLRQRLGLREAARLARSQGAYQGFGIPQSFQPHRPCARGLLGRECNM